MRRQWCPLTEEIGGAVVAEEIQLRTEARKSITLQAVTTPAWPHPGVNAIRTEPPTLRYVDLPHKGQTMDETG